jgi:uncharacterized membrane protein YeiH
MDQESIVPAIGWAFRAFDYGASFVWATSGALLAARRGYDFTGVFAIGLVSATGGGLLRDGFFLQQGPPALAKSPLYIVIVAVAALFVMGVGSRIDRRAVLHRVVSVTDALGLGGFAVVGMHLSQQAGLSEPAVVLVGVVNAVGGGMLRSLLLLEVPEIFQPGEPTAVASLAGCLVYLMLTHWTGIEGRWAGLATIAVVAGLRLISVRYRLKTAPALGFPRIEPK